MPSGYDLGGTGWTTSDFGGAPTPDEVIVPCDDCDTTTTADDMDGWDVVTDTDTYETTTLCPSCSGGAE